MLVWKTRLHRTQTDYPTAQHSFIKNTTPKQVGKVIAAKFE